MIGYLLLVIFLILVAKSILETIWGVCLLLCGLGWHIIGMILDVLIFGERLIKKMRKISVFCLLGTCAITSISHAQTSNAPTEQPSLVGYVGPVTRTLTSNDGRTVDVVITAKTETAIKARKADGTKFEIALDKLSDADKSFIAGLVASPTKKMTLLQIGAAACLGNIDPAEFQVTKVIRIQDLEKITDQELNFFDATIVTLVDFSEDWDPIYRKDTVEPGTNSYIQRDRILRLMSQGKIVAWRSYHKLSKLDFIAEKGASIQLTLKKEPKDQEPFVDVQGDVIFFSTISRIHDRETSKGLIRGSGGDIHHQDVF